MADIIFWILMTVVAVVMIPNAWGDFKDMCK